MELGRALDALNVTRVIWIDDVFRKPDVSADSVFSLVEQHSGLTSSIEFPGLSDEVLSTEFGTEPLRKYIDALSVEDRKLLYSKVLDVARTAGGGVELSSQRTADASRVLKIDENDQWSFETAITAIPENCKNDDGSCAYIVDLSNGAGSPNEGLDVLDLLHKSSSRAIIFILTHEATLENESVVEARLRQEFQKKHGAPVPSICVISKQRVAESSDDKALSEQLLIAMKRAGLRKSVSAVLTGAKGRLYEAFDKASDLLLEVPPEQLDKFIVERGYAEGVSELHVVERAIAAKLADDVRTFFATDHDARDQAKKLRAFREVALEAEVNAVHDNIYTLRSLEIWEDATQINKAFSPLSCGDVFILDEEEIPKAQYSDRMFMLLGQPCDVQLRPDGKRDQSSAYLVPLITKNIKENLKSRAMPFNLHGAKWFCDFRNVTHARLNILDLASFRDDGRVALDQAQLAMEGVSMLQGLETAMRKRVALMRPLFERGWVADTVIEESACWLTFEPGDPFNRVSKPLFRPETRQKGVRKLARVTWRLRRYGRVRTPYSTSLLRDYLSLSGREAFEMDYTKLPDVQNQ